MTEKNSVRVNFSFFHSMRDRVVSDTSKLGTGLILLRKAQCGNYGNLISRFFAKNFVKATQLLNNSLKIRVDLTEKYFCEMRVCTVCHYFEDFSSNHSTCLFNQRAWNSQFYLTIDIMMHYNKYLFSISRKFCDL